jgi:hypothetical protein
MNKSNNSGGNWVGTLLGIYLVWVWAATWGERTIGESWGYPPSVIIGWFN